MAKKRTKREEFAETVKLSANGVGVFDFGIITTVITAIEVVMRLCPSPPVPEGTGGIKLNAIQEIVLNNQLKAEAKRNKVNWVQNKATIWKVARETLAKANDPVKLAAFRAEL